MRSCLSDGLLGGEDAVPARAVRLGRDLSRPVTHGTGPFVDLGHVVLGIDLNNAVRKVHGLSFTERLCEPCLDGAIRPVADVCVESAVPNGRTKGHHVPTPALVSVVICHRSYIHRSRPPNPPAVYFIFVEWDKTQEEIMARTGIDRTDLEQALARIAREFQPLPEEPEPELPPEFEGTVSPALIPPFCDIYTREAIYVWVRLVDNGHDLAFEECGNDSLGRVPEWARGDFDVKDVTGMYRGLVDWGLQEGLAPGQPFVLEVHATQGSTDYYGEYDSWNDWGVVHRLPRRPEQAVRAWTRALKNIEEYVAAEKAAAEKLRRLQVEDASAFILRVQDKRWTDNGYQELSPPGLEISLCSRHWRLPVPGEPLGPISFAHAIVWGSSDIGSRELAFMDLIRNIRKRYPDLDIQAVRKIKEVHRHPF